MRLQNCFLQNGADKAKVTKAEVTSPMTSSTNATAERSSIPRSKVLISQTSSDAAERSHSKQEHVEMNGQL